MKIIPTMFIIVVTVGLQFQYATCRLCTREGILCKDCHSIGNCIKDGKNAFKYDVSSQMCPGDVVCDEVSLYCERKGFCRFKEFSCPSNEYEEEVVFPDPYSCIEYHGCQGRDQFDYVCYDGTAFNPATKNCSLRLDHQYCRDYPVPLCESVSQSGYIGGTDYYYECVEEPGPPPVLYPRIGLDVV